GFRELRPLTRDDPHVSKNFAAPRRHLFASYSEQVLALRQRSVVPSSGDIELDLVYREIELARSVSFFLESTIRFRVRGLGIGQLTQLHVGQPDVVEHLCFMIPHSERLVSELAQSERF